MPIPAEYGQMHSTPQNEVPLEGPYVRIWVFCTLLKVS